MTAQLDLRHYRDVDLDTIRGALLDVYAEVYAHRLHEPFNSIERFAERLDAHVTAPHWEAVVGWEASEPIGYIYAATLRAGSAWWSELKPPVEDAFAAETGVRTAVIFELMVRQPWRGTGAALALHEALLVNRQEERTALGVRRSHPQVRAMYERWGYRYVGSNKPFPDAPLLDRMVRGLRS